MEFEFAVDGLQGQGISVWDASRLVHLSSVEFHKLRNVLEDFGQRSAKAQGLRAPITDIWRLRSSSEQRLYLQTAAAGSSACTLLGGLKVGRKKLFVHRANGTIAEIEPLCVLDFYVHESYQRQGVGKAVFECMLAAEVMTPEQLAYDRPSPKLLSFLSKHYGLASYVPQSNNFVVYEQYYQHCVAPSSRRGAAPGTGSSSGGGSTCSSSMNYGMPCSVGNGRQGVHVVGTAAAASAEEAAGQPWVPSSVRPPTPSLQQSVQLHPAEADGSWSSPSSSTRPAAALTASLGGPGCATAGVPTHRPDKHHPSAPQQQQQQQQEVQYARGAGVKTLAHGSYAGPGSNSKATGVMSYREYEQALLAGASNPAPALGGVRDSLDQFTSSLGNSSSTMQQQQQQPASSAAAASSRPPWGTDANTNANAATTNIRRRGAGVFGPPAVPSQVPTSYSLTTPYGSWAPRPNTLLPATAGDADRVSLRRQQEQQQQQRLQQQVARWEALGAGPPGHLLAAPTSSYAVPTVAMAEVISRSQQQQQQQGAGSSQWQQQQQSNVSDAAPTWQQQPNSVLSWDGLPLNAVTRAQKQQQQQQVLAAGRGAHPEQQRQLHHSGSNGSLRNGGGSGSYRIQQVLQPGELGSGGSRGWAGSNCSSRAGSGGGMGHGDLDSLGSAKAAAAVHRSGSGAASCLRMV